MFLIEDHTHIGFHGTLQSIYTAQNKNGTMTQDCLKVNMTF